MSETITRTSLQSDIEAWAQQTLGIATDSNSAGWQGEVLKRLTAHDLVPDDDWYDAIDVYQGTSSLAAKDAPLGYYREREVEARQLLQQFVTRFFDLPPADRWPAWIRLEALCAPWPVLGLKLQRLKRGLDVNPRLAPGASQSTIKLGNLICRNFLWPEGDFAREAWVEIRAMRRDRQYWEQVARTLRRTHPQLYQLAPELVDDFADHSRRLRRQRWQELIPDWSGSWLPADGTTPLTAKHVVSLLLLVGGFLLIAGGVTAFQIATESKPRVNTPSYSPPANMTYGPRSDRDWIEHQKLRQMREGWEHSLNNMRDQRAENADAERKSQIPIPAPSATTPESAAPEPAVPQQPEAGPSPSTPPAPPLPSDF